MERPLSDGDILMALRALNESRQKDSRKMRAYTTSWKYTILEFGAEMRYANSRRIQGLYALLTTNPMDYEVVKGVIAFIKDFLEDDELSFDDFPTGKLRHYFFISIIPSKTNDSCSSKISYHYNVYYFQLYSDSLLSTILIFYFLLPLKRPLTPMG